MKPKKTEQQQTQNMGICPLDQIQPGSTVRIVRVNSGHGLNNRLAAMGLLKDTPVTVVRNDGAGQIIIAVKSSKIILGRGMSHKIFVTNI
jgi:ferrous iron transport protein A